MEFTHGAGAGEVDGVAGGQVVSLDEGGQAGREEGEEGKVVGEHID